jgi:hypothetical protein
MVLAFQKTIYLDCRYFNSDFIKKFEVSRFGTLELNSKTDILLVPAENIKIVEKKNIHNNARNFQTQNFKFKF